MLMVRTVKAMLADATARRGDAPDDAGLTPIHGIAARYIDAHDGATPGELAGHLRVTKQSASEIAAALEHSGYVRRRPHPDDGRARLLELTPKGRTNLAESRARWLAIVQQWESLVGPDDLDIVGRALRAYLDATG